MRKLTTKEREEMLPSLEKKMSPIRNLMYFYKGFGAFTEGVIIYSSMSLDVPDIDFLILIIISFILYFLFLKITNFLYLQNSWVSLYHTVKKRDEFVLEGVLVHSYWKTHGLFTKDFFVVLEINGKEITCCANPSLEGTLNGSLVLLVSTNENYNEATIYATKYIA